jgi:hypothetical protein
MLWKEEGSGTITVLAPGAACARKQLALHSSEAAIQTEPASEELL